MRIRSSSVHGSPPTADLERASSATGNGKLDNGFRSLLRPWAWPNNAGDMIAARHVLCRYSVH